MMTPVGIRLPPMLDPSAEMAKRAANPGAERPQPDRVERLQPNPGVSLDPVSGVIVLEFRNLSGEVYSTAPTARQLNAYRAAALTGSPLPPGMEPIGGSGADGKPPADQPEQTRRA
jgi:hypothetical protein